MLKLLTENMLGRIVRLKCGGQRMQVIGTEQNEERSFFVCQYQCEAGTILQTELKDFMIYDEQIVDIYWTVHTVKYSRLYKSLTMLKGEKERIDLMAEISKLLEMMMNDLPFRSTTIANMKIESLMAFHGINNNSGPMLIFGRRPDDDDNDGDSWKNGAAKDDDE